MYWKLALALIYEWNKILLIQKNGLNLIYYTQKYSSFFTKTWCHRKRRIIILKSAQKLHKNRLSNFKQFPEFFLQTCVVENYQKKNICLKKFQYIWPYHSEILEFEIFQLAEKFTVWKMCQWPLTVFYLHQ